MEHYPSTLTWSESGAFVDRIEKGFEETGYGLWAVERLDRSQFIGYVGLAHRLRSKSTSRQPWKSAGDSLASIGIRASPLRPPRPA